MSDETNAPRSPRYTLGELVRRERKRRKLSQTQLADELDVNQSTVARWEGGERIGFSNVGALAAWLGISVAEAVELNWPASHQREEEEPEVVRVATAVVRAAMSSTQEGTDFVSALDDAFGLRPGTLRWFSAQHGVGGEVRTDPITASNFDELAKAVEALEACEALGLGARLWNSSEDGFSDQWCFEVWAGPAGATSGVTGSTEP